MNCTNRRSSHCDSLQPDDDDELRDLENLAYQVVILGDLNAKSKVWGNPVSNANGRKLNNNLHNINMTNPHDTGRTDIA